MSRTAQIPSRETLVIIPARGGSRGLSRKNVRLIYGKPLVAHSIISGQQALLASRVVVSTDDSEIEGIVKEHSAEVVLRPGKISGDAAPSEAALMHVLDHLSIEEDYSPDLVVFLQPTSPFRLPQDIDGAIRTLIDEEADSVFSAYIEHFCGRWERDNDGLKAINFKLQSRPRRQERPPQYVENGSIYVFKPDLFRESGNRLSGKIAVYEMPILRSLQIDTLNDLEMIETLMHLTGLK